MKETNIINELADILKAAINDYKNVYADCTKKDIQEAFKKLMEEYK